MKQKTIIALKKLVKEMVSREVAKQMKYVIAEITAPINSKTVSKQPAVNTVLEREKNLQHQATYITTEPEEKQYAKDPILNKILNETQGGIPGENEPYPTMGGTPYTTQNTDQLASPQMAQMNTATMPDFMKKAMSGHSASVVKAIEKKHGTKS